MPFQDRIRGPVLYVSWRGVTPEDLEAVARRVAELHVSLKRPVVYLSRIPYDTTLFSAGEQTALLEFLLRILPHCATLHHVVEGEGFVKSARRAIVTNMALATPRPRDFYTHSTVAEAALLIDNLHHVDLQDLVSRASVTPDEPREATIAFREAGRIAESRPRRRG